VEDEDQALWRDLMAATGAGNLACQLRLARQYVSLHPRDVAGLCILGETLGKMERHSEARSTFCSALRLASMDKDFIRHKPDFICVQIGHMYNHKGNHHRAEMWYRRAVKISASTNNLVFLGSCLAREGRFDEAEHLLCRAVKVESSNPDEAYYNLAIIFRNTGRYDEALVCLERAIELDPDYELAKGARDDILQMQKIGDSIQPSRADGRGQSD
jgi:tetratricopeptide (TPR) repeat protein